MRLGAILTSFTFIVSHQYPVVVIAVRMGAFSRLWVHISLLWSRESLHREKKSRRRNSDTPKKIIHSILSLEFFIVDAFLECCCCCCCCCCCDVDLKTDKNRKVTKKAPFKFCKNAAPFLSSLSLTIEWHVL